MDLTNSDQMTTFGQNHSYLPIRLKSQLECVAPETARLVSEVSRNQSDREQDFKQLLHQHRLLQKELDIERWRYESVSQSLYEMKKDVTQLRRENKEHAEVVKKYIAEAQKAYAEASKYFNLAMDFQRENLQLKEQVDALTRVIAQSTSSNQT